jgi:DNA polymerase III gamma/tau subunit
MADGVAPNISWFEKWRPAVLDDVVFNNNQEKEMIQTWITDGKIPGNVLLFGPPGTGKTTLGTILIKLLIKSQGDLYVMKTRSVNEIDDNIKPFVVKRPIQSKGKIVYIEEIDKILRQGQNTLKDGLLEKYQEYVSFICCTNFIKRIDPALLTRFTYKIEFISDNKEGIKARLEYILNQEQTKYNQSEFAEFVDKNYKHGLRDLINELQVSAKMNNGVINFKDLDKNLNIEDNVISYIHRMLHEIMKCQDLNSKKLCLVSPFNSIIAKDYQEFVTIVHNNFDINYESIFRRLYETTRFLPLQVLIGNYAEDIETKKYPHLHLISCFYELMKCVTETSM